MTTQARELPLSSAIDHDDRSWYSSEDAFKRLECPTCGDTYQHAGSPETIDSRDNYEARWGGRGDLIVIPIWGECQHEWEICFGFHKGETVSFVNTGRSLLRR